MAIDFGVGWQCAVVCGGPRMKCYGDCQSALGCSKTVQNRLDNAGAVSSSKVVIRTQCSCDFAWASASNNLGFYSGEESCGNVSAMFARILCDLSPVDTATRAWTSFRANLGTDIMSRRPR